MSACFAAPAGGARATGCQVCEKICLTSHTWGCTGLDIVSILHNNTVFVAVLRLGRYDVYLTHPFYEGPLWDKGLYILASLL
jgi:hypothetical protein